MIGKIYTLSCSKSGQVFYVGCTFGCIDQRRKAHVLQSKKRTTRLHKYIMDNGIIPKVELLDKIVVRSWRYEWRLYELEGYWIEQMRQWGFGLVNSCKNVNVCNKILKYK